jgi:hypothetical protein
MTIRRKVITLQQMTADRGSLSLRFANALWDIVSATALILEH